MKALNYYRGDNGHPYHLSVGAVVVNENKDVLCHYYTEIPAAVFGERETDIHLLMTESVEAGERLEETVLRGVGEEFGIEGNIQTFLGSLQSFFYRDGSIPIAKTTLYFLVEYKKEHPELKKLTGWESSSVPKWVKLSDLILIKEEEKKRLADPHNDQLSILRNAKGILEGAGNNA